MKLKKDAKFGEEFTCCFKIDIRNLTNSDPISRKSPKFSLQWAPFEQSIYIYIYCLSLKSTEEVSFKKLNRDTKFGEESTYHFKIDITLT